MADASPRCPRCGAELRAPGEPCPACLLRGALGDESDETRLTPPGVAAPSSARTEHPTQIGPYRIVRILGEGGMGVVYLAEQTEPLRRQVALKVIKLGMDTRDVVARFEAERQALALMDHPHIASVYDAGATADGRPYFAMEYVAGAPITDYCDRQQLPTRARLELFMDVCDAIQHAHQKGLIHRDIKPSNVLVVDLDGTPAPKVIDFGIAKATAQRLTERTMFTQHGLVIGTPEYMSPEQADPAGGDLDTRTDIYALGVVLYELLVGGLPFSPTRLREAAYSELLRIIREEEPVRPSARLTTLGAAATKIAALRQTKLPTLAQQLRGDLDWITLKALAKDRNRRYGSASELAADVRRYLSQEPVIARPPTLSYRVGKFVRRHRVGVLAAGLAVTALVTGLMLSTAFFLRARAAQATASEESYFATLAAADLLLRSNQPSEARKRLDAAPAGLRDWEWDYLYATSDSSVASIGSQAGEVMSVSFTPDGSRILAITDHGVLQGIDASTHLPIALFRYPAAGSEDVEAIVAVSRDGARTASIPWRMPVSGGVGRVKGKMQFHASPNAWRTAYTERERTLTVRETTSRAVAGRWILPSVGLSPLLDPPEGGIAFGDNEIKDPVTWRTVARMGGNRGAPAGAVFSADALRVAAWSWDNVLRVWDLRTGASIATLSGHRDGIASAAFTRDGRSLATACHDGKIRIWDAGSSAPERILTGHDQGVNAIAVSSDERMIASAGADRTVRLWNFADGRLLGTYVGHEGEVTSVAFSPDGRLVASASADRTVRLWLVAQPGSEHLARWLGHLGPVNTVAFSPDGRQLASGSSDSTVRVWSTDGVRPLPAIRGLNLFGTTSTPSDTLHRIAWSASDGILLWSLKPPFEVSTLSLQTKQQGALALSHDGQFVVTGTSDHTLRVATAGQVAVQTLGGHTQEITAVAISVDGRRAASASNDHTIRVWNLEAASTVRTIALGGRVSDLAFSPDGRRLAGIVGDRVAVWDVTNGEWLLQHGMPDHSPGAIAFSPDGTRLAAAFNDSQSTVEVLDIVVPRVVAALRGTAESIGSIAFDRTGRRLVAASADGTIRIWDAQSSRQLLAFEPGPKYLKVVAFHRDGGQILAATDHVALVLDRRSAYLPEAVKAVEPLPDVSVSDVLTRLQHDVALDDRTRTAAIELARRRGDVPDKLNTAAWRIVKAPGDTEENYRRALASSETAVRLMPFERSYVNTLAAAQYRVGRYERALDTITRLMAVRETPSARDRVVSVLARLRLGQFGDTRADLNALFAIKNPSDDLKALIAEAKAVSESRAKGQAR